MKVRYYITAVLIAIAALVFMRSDSEKIAVLDIQGVIISSDPYLRALRKIEKEDSFKALVVRIDSPGGSVAASQEIYSYIKRLGEKIPVVSSIAGMGTSGGYYVACGASSIVANPGTLTGSIGVIAKFANFGELLRWAKIDFDVLKSGKLKDTGSPLRRLSDEEKKYLQAVIDNSFEHFRRTVAESRNINPEYMNLIFDGRVVTGQKAKEWGLVDETGSFWKALEMAAEKAAIPKESDFERFPKKDFNLLRFAVSGDSGKLLNKHLSWAGLSSGIYYLSEPFVNFN